MRITKFGHACVRIEHEGQVVVIDPGGFTERDAVDGATAVLVTHEHYDHYSEENLAATDAPIWAIGAVAQRMTSDLRERTTIFGPGESFDAGIPVRAVGERHAVIHPDMPVSDNCGLLLDVNGQFLYHPGDSFTLPGQQVDVLFAPVSGPWLKLSEVLDFVRAIGARRTLAIHELVLSEIGLGMSDGRIKAFLEGRGDYYRVKSREDLPG